MKLHLVVALSLIVAANAAPPEKKETEASSITSNTVASPSETSATTGTPAPSIITSNDKSDGNDKTDKGAGAIEKRSSEGKPEKDAVTKPAATEAAGVKEGGSVGDKDSTASGGNPTSSPENSGKSTGTNRKKRNAAALGFDPLRGQGQ